MKSSIIFTFIKSNILLLLYLNTSLYYLSIGFTEKGFHRKGSTEHNHYRI